MSKQSLSTLLLLIVCCHCSYGQLVTPFTIRAQATQKGGIRFISNASVSCTGATCDAGRNQVPPAGTATNNGFTMAFIDNDNDASTFMSSSDSISLPLCSEITWAGIYWGGSMVTSMPNYTSRFSVKLKVNSLSYQTLTAEVANRQTYGANYFAFSEITGVMKAAGGNARMTVADLVSDVSGNNKYAGWTIVVLYRNDLQPMRNLTVFNGLSNVTSGTASVDVPISGFLTPLSGPVSFELGVIAYDGDRSSIGDSLQFNGAGSFLSVADGIHRANDMFNSTISYNGSLTPFRLPLYNNTLGYDANIFLPNNSTKNYIGNSATSATIRLTTASEAILSIVLTSAIDIYEPDIRAAVKVIDLNAGQVEPGDTLEYTIICKNIGSDPSINSFVTDTIEGNASFVTGSLRVTYGPNSGIKSDVAADDQGEYNASNKTLKIRIGTGANGYTGGTMLPSPAGTDSTVIKFRVAAASDCIYLQCDHVIDNRAYIYGTGNVSGNTYNNGSNPGIFDGNGCPIPGTTSSAINVGLCSPLVVSSQSPACPGGPINLFASPSPSATYAWSGPNGFSSTSVNPVIVNATSAMAGTYSVIVSITGTACAFPLSIPVTVGSTTQPGGVAGTAGAGSSGQSQEINISSGYYTDNACNIITRVQPSGVNAVTGNIASRVWIESSVPVHIGAPYVARHYEVTPANNPASATGTVTLFFLQSEFTAFNAAPGSVLNLPTGPGDAPGTANLRIGQYTGTSSDNSGLPASYPSAGTTVIDPADGNITWNATAGRWEVTFAVSGFGGFIVQTSEFVLPVNWVSFHAEQLNDKVLVRWQTAAEKNTSHFVVQHSIDGSKFNPAGSVASAGNSTGLTSYEFVHNGPQKGGNFYRVQAVDLDARGHLSSIARIDLKTGPGKVIVWMEPAKSGRLQVLFSRATTAIISSSQGVVLRKEQVMTGSQALNISNLPAGIYILRAGDESRRFIIK